MWIIDEVRKLIDDYDAIVFVGDYADDWGSQPIDTINTWKELRSLSHINPKVKLVQGNHDYIYTNKVDTTSGGYSMGTQFLLDLPDNKGLKEWLNSLPTIEYVDGVMYSHAGVLDAWAERYNGQETPESMWNDLSPIWVRPDYGFDYRPYQVFGHTPSETCWEVQPNVWCIDTFSTTPDGQSIGDGTVLEIINGKIFNKIKLEQKK